MKDLSTFGPLPSARGVAYNRGFSTPPRMCCERSGFLPSPPGGRTAIQGDRWRTISPSIYEWERSALDYLREQLPDHDPYRAWSNFEFITPTGKIYEVDLLVLDQSLPKLSPQFSVVFRAGEF